MEPSTNSTQLAAAAAGKVQGITQNLMHGISFVYLYLLTSGSAD